MESDQDIIVPDQTVNPSILFDELNIKGKTRLSHPEVFSIAVNYTLIAYEKNPNIDVMEHLTNEILSLTRSRDNKKGTVSDQYIEGVRVRLLSMRNMPKEQSGDIEF